MLGQRAGGEADGRGPHRAAGLQGYQGARTQHGPESAAVRDRLPRDREGDHAQVPLYERLRAESGAPRRRLPVPAGGRGALRDHRVQGAEPGDRANGCGSTTSTCTIIMSTICNNLFL